MKAHLIDKHLLLPRSSAKVKVKYQGHVSQKMGVSGAFVFHKHILFAIVLNSLLQGHNSHVSLPLAINSVPNDKISDWFNFKAIADNKINVAKKLKFVFGRI